MTPAPSIDNARADALDRRLRAVEEELAKATERLGAIASTLDDHGRQLQVRTVMDWIAATDVRPTKLISVILPTRDRAALLPRAIASVMAQSYPHWELLIVDDGSVDTTPKLLADIQDTRIRRFRTGGGGVCAARNAALAEARGEFIAYLDDDNIMMPNWLKSVAWGFEQRPAATVLYGGIVVDDLARVNRKGSGQLPRLFFWPYDRRAVTMNNIADIGCIAHRRGLPEAHFDPELRELGDWDLFLRLTRDAPPLTLPAVACMYTTEAEGRLSHGPKQAEEIALVRKKNPR